jgi:BlaI family transcriptional regulator, penicillinase repressor
MTSRPGTLTPQELAIMKVVWRLEKATIREIYEALREQRTIAYTTVQTMVKILEQKGHLKKQKAERAAVYRAAHPRQRVVTSMVREFVNRVFDGATQPLLLQLVKERQLSEEEREELLRLIRESE